MESVVGDNDLYGIIPEEGGDHACLSTCYVSCSHWSYDEPWLLDITGTSVAIIGLFNRTEYPPRCEDFAEPPHYRPVHWRSRLQMRGVLQLQWLSIRTVLPADNPNSGRSDGPLTDGHKTAL
jgi:hypothetical protein